MALPENVVHAMRIVNRSIGVLQTEIIAAKHDPGRDKSEVITAELSALAQTADNLKTQLWVFMDEKDRTNYVALADI